ncbi:TATA box-binding protein-associated factor RNA polymerase I subunit B [Ricinus communis]|uniref:TATA box-binding protein-associated factor RNA polymerase I subunit B n=1 Tax=Ricinus communis TaxID=3988 RepID=B9S8W3_RICCO|nr:TATA box-binding protein-associated factor RNA polymerase I subunit B [Ricinus communis]EEF39924.1 conserved hypothetical protein [Ricinus communis]|eukprot:XP_002522432.1 TATA box-binding protein-associated factor RNA polymerase I subunit B [Ricinus communis]
MENGGEGETKRWACRRCGHVGLEESDGFYYCQECGAQADDIILTGVADEDFIEKDGEGGGALYSARFTRYSQPTRTIQTNPSSQAWFRYTQEEEDINFTTTTTLNGTYSNIKIKKEERFDDDEYLDGLGPVEPEDFGGKSLSYEDYYNEVRIRYVMGMQWMIQLQCESLVEKFNVSPLICGVAGNVWLRFLVATGVFKDNWADDVILESESQVQGEPEDWKPRSSHRNEPHNAYGQRAVMVWFKYLRKTIPLSSSLAISFLACHVAREAILPTDIVRWSIEGKLPYFAAHVEIEKRFEHSSPACPISSSLMFRPSQAVPAQKLESMAAAFAESIGLHLPPVNFYEIASRYLKNLALPVEKILPHACRIYEWSMPPDLWLSTNELRLPTRVTVMSILIVAIRILYNLNGFGAWERSLSSLNCSPSNSHPASRLDSMCRSVMQGDAETGSPFYSLDGSAEKFLRNPSHMQMPELDSAELLHHLEVKYNFIADAYEFTKDLPSYLQYCKDVVFAGAGPSHMDDLEEEELMEKLWDFYQNEKDSELAKEPRTQSSSRLSNQKRSRNDDGSVFVNLSEKEKIKEEWHDSPSADISSHNADNSSHQSFDNGHFSNNSLEDQNVEHKEKDSEKTLEGRAIRRLKLDMEENRFCYIPPRVNLKRFDYLHYVRKKDEGAFTYVAHADYYILLRACARVAQVDIRIMHIGVLSFERRLAWLEKRIDYCLHLSPPTITCEFCRDMPDHNSNDDVIGLSKLNL